MPMLIGLCITLGLRFQLKSLGEVSGKIWGGLWVNLEVQEYSSLEEQCC